jgi:class 3 adenylate cyclase
VIIAPAVFRRVERGGQDLLLKIGIHEGPCLAVMLNDRQDYFGQTVNIASRVQHLALSQAIFASGSVVTDPNGSAILTNSGVVPIPRQAALRGITDEFEVYELPLGAPQDLSARG